MYGIITTHRESSRTKCFISKSNWVDSQFFTSLGTFSVKNEQMRRERDF